MADSKVSELTEATSASSHDEIYLVQSSTSKKISVGNLLGDAANVTLTGNIKVGDTPQSITSPTVISLSTPISKIAATSGGVLQLPPGQSGQIKIIIMSSTTGSGVYTINRANISGNGNVQFAEAGDTATCMYETNTWFVIGGTANVVYD